MKLLKNFLIAPSLVLLLSTNLLAKNYTLEAMPLKEVIKLITSDLNLPYVVDSKFVEGKRSKSIENIEGGLKALNKILKDFNLKAEIKNDLIVIKKMKINNSSSSTLEDVEVIENVDLGTSQEGYLIKNTSNIGAFKGKSLQDTPYALNIMSEEYMDNLQATSVDQLYGISPVMQVHWSERQNSNGYVMLRGFKSAVSAYNGMRREPYQYTHNINVEEYERLETLTGLSGFLYGPSPIGGMRNFISKSPSSSKKNTVTLGNAGGKGVYGHVDFTSALDEEGRFSYRLNTVVQDGETFVENQNLKKTVFNLAIDYELSDNILFQGVISDSSYRLDGRQAYWKLAPGVARPDASKIDSNNLLAPEWAFQETSTRRYTTNIFWNISDNMTFRSAYMQESSTKSGVTAYNTIAADDTYSTSIQNYDAESDYYGKGAYAFLDIDFNTENIKHTVTAGMQFSQSYYDSGSSVDWSTGITGETGLSFSTNPSVTKPISTTITGSNTEKGSYTTAKNITLGDSITFDEQWSLLLGASFLKLEYVDNEYKKSAWTPSMSLVYKPIEDLTLYGSYMEGFELGGIAGDTTGGVVVTNAGEVFDPLKSTQVELGAKYSHNNMLYTLALFNINKGLQYYDKSDAAHPTYVQDGRQVHRGLEFTFTGKASENLIAVGGFTILDAQVEENKSNPNLEGNRPSNVSDKFAKLYLEYTLPNKKNLSFNMGINYTGGFYGDKDNTDKIPGYTLINIGTRYTSKSGKYPLTYRLNINNLTDKDYWVNNYFLGEKRTVHASVTMEF